jgi:hypothetical protein
MAIAMEAAHTIASKDKKFVLFSQLVLDNDRVGYDIKKSQC